VKLAPTVEIIVAVGAASVLWFGARHVLEQIRGANAVVAFSRHQDEHHREHQGEDSGRDH